MSKNPDFEKEMIEFEEEKLKEFFKEIAQQLQAIENHARQIKPVLEKYREAYSLEFDNDVLDRVYNIVFEAI